MRVFVSITEAAQITGRSRPTVRDWNAAGLLQAVEDLPSGGRKGQPRNTHWIDADELYEVHMARGGTIWRSPYTPEEYVAAQHGELLTLLQDMKGLLALMEQSLAVGRGPRHQ
jgi:transposase